MDRFACEQVVLLQDRTRFCQSALESLFRDRRNRSEQEENLRPPSVRCSSSAVTHSRNQSLGQRQWRVS
jgi:hypothetical protein